MDKRNLRFFEMREKLGFTQRELGASVGLSQSMIAHIEAGTKEPSSLYRILLAKTFGVSVDWLFYEAHYEVIALHEMEVMSHAANCERLSTHS